jgi:phosphoribosylformylglycinamidine synthase
MPSPTALIIRSPGTNCDAELARAFQLAGAEPQLIHLDRLIHEPDRVRTAPLIALAGGFSYGDDVAAGRILAVRLRRNLYPALRDAVERGACVLGVCNGFQVLCQCGLLPGPAAGEPWPAEPARPRITLAENRSGRFIDRWVRIAPEPDSPCLWTAPLLASDLSTHARLLPVANGEGRVAAADPAALDQLEAAGRVALRYAEDDDPNGSARRIAGVCDASGRVLGLMPHPERYLSWTHHPWRSRLSPAELATDPPGLRMFQAAVAAAAALQPA